MSEYVIIGNGTAAVSAIDGIRSVDKESEITLVSKEKFPVYGRPLISYYLQGKTTVENMLKFRPVDFYEKNQVKVLYNTEAVKIEAHTVLLSNGELLPFDKLLIATGSTPFVPPFAGLDTVDKKYSFMTLQDTLDLEEAISENSEVLIMGAGLIGLKCAEGILKRVKKLTVCDLAPHILPSILDEECASMMAKPLVDAGVEFMLSNTVDHFDGNKAYFKNGEELSFDVLVLAVGVRPNVQLAKDLGCDVNRGILVNDHMETTVPGIYSAGDCTEGFDLSLGSNRILAILPNATLQGITAGKNMAGCDTAFENPIPMNSIGFFGTHAMSAGTYYKEEDGAEIYEEKTESTLKRLFIKDDYLTGFMLIGENEKAGIYTSLIRNHTPLSQIDFNLLKEGPTLAAFPESYRKEKLGGK